MHACLFCEDRVIVVRYLFVGKVDFLFIVRNKPPFLYVPLVGILLSVVYEEGEVLAPLLS